MPDIEIELYNMIFMSSTRTRVLTSYFHGDLGLFLQYYDSGLFTGDGVLNKAEYVNLISGFMVDPEVVRSELKEAFKTFDKSKRGYLDLQQMTKALACLGEPLSDMEIKQLIKIADKNNDGKIDVDGTYWYQLLLQYKKDLRNCRQKCPF